MERGLTLGQLAEQTGLSKSALGSYETEDFKDISHYALIKLAKFYGVTADYLLGLSETRKCLRHLNSPSPSFMRGIRACFLRHFIP